MLPLGIRSVNSRAGRRGPPIPDSPFLHDWVFFHAERTPHAPVVADPASRLTYGDLAERVRDLADRLSAAGIGCDDRVLVALPNTPATVALTLALTFVGAVSVEVNREWDAELLRGIARSSRPRGLAIWGPDARKWAPVLPAASPAVACVVQAGAPAEDVRALAVPALIPIEPDGRSEADGPATRSMGSGAADRDRPALCLYTSGSTGMPHGVIQTHRNIDANARSIVEYLQLTADDRAMLTLPLSYCYGRSVLQTHLLVGGSIFLDQRFAFPRVVLETIAAEGCTGFAGVPLTFEIIRRQVDVASLSFPRLRYVTQAGGPMAVETARWVRRAFHPAKLFVMYGQTEATARLSYLPPERAAEKEGSIGIAIPGVELAVVDEQGREVPRGVTGEVVARGDNVTPGYLDDPDETAAILHDGWLWTGDLAYRDPDGFFFLVGRSKEILKIGGHRVSPTAIEQVIARHPDVAEVAVIGTRDDLLGEVPVAFLVPRADRRPGENELRLHCRARLPAYEVPVRFVLLDELPRGNSGKVLRAVLSSRYAS